MVLPIMATVLLVPIVFVENVPVAPVVDKVTVSAATLPTSAALVFTRVAVTLALYTLLLAVMPLMVRVLAVMFAEVVGWVSV